MIKMFNINLTIGSFVDMYYGCILQVNDCACALIKKSDLHI